MSAEVALSPARRGVLTRLADLIVPACGELPAAGTLDLGGAPIDRLLRLRPDLLPPLRVLLEECAALPPADLPTWLDALSPTAMAVLLQVVAGAYYLQPEVRRLIGYPGQEALTLPRDGFGGEELLMAMMQSPPRFRSAPAE